MRLVMGLVALAFVAGCKNEAAPVPEKLDLVSREFEAELKRRKFTFKQLADGRYEVESAALEASEFTLTVSIENLKREVERDRDLGAIGRFIDRFEQIPEGNVPWAEAKSTLRFSLEPNDYDAETMSAALQRPAGQATMLVLTRITKNGDVRWVTKNDLEEWGVTRKEAEKLAGENLDALLLLKEPNINQVGTQKLGMLPIEAASKASVMFAPNFRKFVEPKMGWPVLAVAPSRDFVYLFTKDDFDLVGRAGRVVLEEFAKSDHPISTEIWKVSDAGVETIGSLGKPKSHQ